jgi:hypothetical protein
MIKSIAGELRAIAERCSEFARECERPDLSEALEGLSVDLMAKASELESRFDQ